MSGSTPSVPEHFPTKEYPSIEEKLKDTQEILNQLPDVREALSEILTTDEEMKTLQIHLNVDSVSLVFSRNGKSFRVEQKISWKAEDQKIRFKNLSDIHRDVFKGIPKVVVIEALEALIAKIKKHDEQRDRKVEDEEGHEQILKMISPGGVNDLRVREVFDLERDIIALGSLLKQHPHRDKMYIDQIIIAVKEKTDAALARAKAPEQKLEAMRNLKEYLEGFYYYSLAYLTKEASNRWRIFGDAKQINTDNLIKNYIQNIEAGDKYTVMLLYHKWGSSVDTFPDHKVKSTGTDVMKRMVFLGDKGSTETLRNAYGVIVGHLNLPWRFLAGSREDLKQSYTTKIVEVFEGHINTLNNQQRVNIYHWSIFRLNEYNAMGTFSKEQLEKFLGELERACSNKKPPDISTVTIELQEKSPVEGGRILRPSQRGRDYPPPLPPSSYTPSMTDRGRQMESLDQADRYYTVTPPLNADYKSEIYPGFENGKWKRENPRLQSYGYSEKLEDIHTIQGLATGKVVIPLPYSYRLERESLKVSPQIKARVLEDQYGIAYIIFDSQKTVSYSIRFGRDENYTLRTPPTNEEKADILKHETLRDDTKECVESLKSDESMKPREKAELIRQFIIDNFDYSTSDADARYYRANGGREYFNRLDERRKADCDVANAYFVALCREAGIPSRMVSGYASMEQWRGQNILGPVNYHGWAEIWDGKQWVKFDATPEWREKEQVPAPGMTEEPVPEKESDKRLEIDSPEYNELIEKFRKIQKPGRIEGEFDHVLKYEHIFDDNIHSIEVTFGHNAPIFLEGKLVYLVKIDHYLKEEGKYVYKWSEYRVDSSREYPAEGIEGIPSLDEHALREFEQEHGMKIIF